MDKVTCPSCGTRLIKPSGLNRHIRLAQCPKSPVERFWAKVDKDGPVPEYRPDLGRCWLWTAERNPLGYGMWREWHRSKHGHAARFAWEYTYGPMSAGMQTDHLCRVTACVRPSHLEPVTPRENQRRIPGGNATKTHCKHGHEFTPENTISYDSGTKRGCRACAKVNSRASYLRKRAA